MEMTIDCVELELKWGGIKGINFDTLLLSTNDKFVLKLVVTGGGS